MVQSLTPEREALPGPAPARPPQCRPENCRSCLDYWVFSGPELVCRVQSSFHQLHPFPEGSCLPELILLVSQRALENKYESCLFSFAALHQQVAIGTKLQVLVERAHIFQSCGETSCRTKPGSNEAIKQSVVSFRTPQGARPWCAPGLVECAVGGGGGGSCLFPSRKPVTVSPSVSPIPGRHAAMAST